LDLNNIRRRKTNTKSLPIILILALSFAQIKGAEDRGSTSSSKDTVRLAVVMGGAVTLGAFEAGAIAQLVQDLEYHNQHGTDTHYVIDVVAGASAGAVTLSLLSHELFFPRQAGPKKPWIADPNSNNIFYNAWVKDANIKKLLPERGPDPHKLKMPFYLFSTDSSFGQIGENYLPDLESKLDSGSSGPTALSIAPDSLFVAMTLASMSARKQVIPFENRKHTYIIDLYDDARYFKLVREPFQIRVLDTKYHTLDPNTVRWKDIRNTAIASGAFPFAFAPKKLVRYPGEVAPMRAKRDTTFYVDGGVFNNNPLNIAREMADYVDHFGTFFARPQSPVYRSYSRKFIFIWPTDIEEDESQMDSTVITEITKYFGHLLKMEMNTAWANDYRAYLENDEKNQTNIKALLRWVSNLKDEKVKDILNAVQVLKGSIQDSSQVIDKLEYDTDLDPLLEKRLISAKQDDVEHRNLNNSLKTAANPRKQLYVDLFDLFGYSPQHLYIAISNDSTTKLAGRHFAHFGGAFNQELREHDYQLGRYFCREILKEHLKLKTDSLGYIPDTANIRKQYPNAAAVAAMKSFDIKKHLPKEEERYDLRKRLDARLIAYRPHFTSGLLASAFLETADYFLDRKLYRTPKSIYVSWHINTDRDRSFNLGVQVSPWNILRSKFYQVSGNGLDWGWLWWFISSETHLVFDVGLTDFLTDSFLNTYYYNLGLRLNLYIPGKFEFFKIQPEVGANLTTEPFRTDLNLNNAWGSHFALTTHAAIFDIKFLIFYDKFFENASGWRINFGVSTTIFDRLLLHRL
jgi:predicted acylesterase/phospholipase RssA